MSPFDIVRAWKDEEYRDQLSHEQRTSLPSHPAGLVELSDAQLGDVSGGIRTVGGVCDMNTILQQCTPDCSSWGSCNPHCC